MSNEQLLILITSWANRLEREIELLENALPDDLERFKNPVYVGKQIVPFFDKDPDSWKNEPGDFVIMFGLHGLLSELRDAQEILKGEKDNRS